MDVASLEGDRSGVPIPRLRAVGLSKAYHGVGVVKSVSLEVKAGEIVGLVGHNGAGKSTLGRLLAHVEAPDSGEIYIDGRRVSSGNARTHIKLGVGVIPQALTVVSSLTARQQMALGLAHAVSRRTERRERIAATALALGISRLDAPVREHSATEQRLIMIGQVLVRQPKVVLLDEPTAAFSGDTVERLLAAVRQLARDGSSVVYVSHRLVEVRDLASRIIVLSGGEIVALRGTDTLEYAELVDLVAGRHIEMVRSGVTVDGQRYVQEAPTERQTVFKCRGLGGLGAGRTSSFTVEEGEIVCVTGLVGMGRSRLMDIVCGVHKSRCGSMWLMGMAYRPRSLKQAMKRGLAYVPAERANQGVFPGMTVVENATIVSLKDHKLLGSPLIRGRRERRQVDKALRQMAVRHPGLRAPMRTLSGGNQQKVVLVRWLARGTCFVVLDEPTEGVDVAGREDIYRVIRELAADGKGVLVSSSDIEEVVSLADRALVMRNGGVVQALQRAELTVEGIRRACLFDGRTSARASTA
ncbi:MAG: sugar ABC transporter ATP-binding protein [Acidimicrobiales bacterium]